MRSVKPDLGKQAEHPDSKVPVVRLSELSLRYGKREVLRGVSLEVRPGELFGLLGPNGSGKSSLLRILATLLNPGQGLAEIKGRSVTADPVGVRHSLGVVFQAPSVDDKLTVTENLRLQGHLYGLSGQTLKSRIQDVLARFQLAQRAGDKVGTLSGGYRRRVELAKALLHRPPVLLLDEPSAGLDLAAQRSFWEALADLRRENGLTILVATHLMDEAERCDRVAMLDQGALVAMDTPAGLKKALGETVIRLDTGDPKTLAEAIRTRLGLEARVVNEAVQLGGSDPAQIIPKLWKEFGSSLRHLHLGHPTLADVFLTRTGHALESAGDTPKEEQK